jgi:hypothetical protein
MIKILLKKSRLPVALFGAIAASAIVNSGSAKAVLVYELIEQGSDVQVKLSGSMSGLPTGATDSGGLNSGSGFQPSLGRIILSDCFFCIGLRYAKSSGPSNIGSSTAFSNITSLSKSIDTYFHATLGLTLPTSYVQGTAITASGLITGQSLATLGLSSTSGLLGTWTIGSDSIEVWAGAKPAAPSAVPGPLPLLGAGTALAFSRRLRSRLRGANPAPQA